MTGYPYYYFRLFPSHQQNTTQKTFLQIKVVFHIINSSPPSQIRERNSGSSILLSSTGKRNTSILFLQFPPIYLFKYTEGSAFLSGEWTVWYREPHQNIVFLDTSVSANRLYIHMFSKLIRSLESRKQIPPSIIKTFHVCSLSAIPHPSPSLVQEQLLRRTQKKFYIGWGSTNIPFHLLREDAKFHHFFSD